LNCSNWKKQSEFHKHRSQGLIKPNQISGSDGRATPRNNSCAGFEKFMKTLAHSDKNIAQLKQEIPGAALNFGIEFEANTMPIITGRRQEQRGESRGARRSEPTTA
jgi:hypothetical protein